MTAIYSVGFMGIPAWALDRSRLAPRFGCSDSPAGQAPVLPDLWLNFRSILEPLRVAPTLPPLLEALDRQVLSDGELSSSAVR